MAIEQIFGAGEKVPKDWTHCETPQEWKLF